MKIQNLYVFSKKIVCFFWLYLLIFCFSGCESSNKNISQEFTPTGRGEYLHILFNNCTFSKTASNYGIINDNNHEIASGYIFKYAHDTKRYVAFHKMELNSNYSNENTIIYKRKINNVTYGVVYDNFCIYDSVNGNILNFETTEDLNNYCIDNNVALGNWYYPSGDQSIEGIQTKLSADYVFEDIGKYRGQSILKNGIPIFSGYIHIVDTPDNYIIFNLKIAESDFDVELRNTTNVGLSTISSKKVDTYFVNFWLKFPVYYNKYIVLNVQTGCIHEFEHEKDALKFVTNQGTVL